MLDQPDSIPVIQKNTYNIFILLTLAITPCWAGPFVDWIVDPQAKNLCGGYYQEPNYPYPLRASQIQYPFTLSADEINADARDQCECHGAASLSQGNQRLEAEYLVLRRENNEIKKIEAHTNIILTQPGMRIEASTGTWDPIEQTINLQKVAYRYYPRKARGLAKKITITPDCLSLQNASYTTCAPCSNTWLLSSKYLTLNKTQGRGYGRHVTLNMKNVPIFYWPYLNFPIDGKRHSGFLSPKVSFTSNSGLEIAQPYYFNLAPNYDYLITPYFLSNRGLKIQNELRYLTTHSDGEIELTTLLHDTKRHKSRHLLKAVHNERFSPHLRGDVNAQWVSDDNYFIDLEKDIDLINTTQLLQEVGLHYSNLHWEHTLRFQQYQTLHPLSGIINQENYRRQPQWTFHAYYPVPKTPLLFELDGEFTHFTQDMQNQQRRYQGDRYHIRPSMAWFFENSAVHVKPRIQLDCLGYNLKTNNPSPRMIPLIDLHTGLCFEKNFTLLKKPCRQTLEPSLYYLYVPYFNQQNYPNFDSAIIPFSSYQQQQDNHFSGRDRVGDANQLSAMLLSRFYNGANQELMRAYIGKTFQFKKPTNTLLLETLVNHQLANETSVNYSDLCVNIDIYPHNHYALALGLEWEPTINKTQKAFISLQYQPLPDKVLNINYSWIRPDQELNTLSPPSLEQLDLSFTWPLNPQCSLLAQAHYDLQEHRLISFLAGIEYHGCCLAYQLVASRYLKPTYGTDSDKYATGVFFQVMFKGLSTFSLGGHADTRLSVAIPGYHPFRKKT